MSVTVSLRRHQKSPFEAPWIWRFRDWKRYEGVVTIPPGTRQIVVASQIYGPGTVWFDDLKAEYTTDPTGT